MKRLETNAYLFSNRRSDKPGIEQSCGFEVAETVAIRQRRKSLATLLSDSLRTIGVRHSSRELLHADTSEPTVGEFAHWVAVTAILLQQATGHAVSETLVIPSEKAEEQRVWFEAEHSDVGRQAARLALRLVSDLIPELDVSPELVNADQDTASWYAEFAAFSAERVLPHDAQSILDACTRLDIPCVKLDRAPYEGVSGDFRIRKNGLLKLGHACHTQVVDGTVCIDKSPLDPALFKDRDALFRKLWQLGMPVAAQDPHFRNLRTPGRAVRVAESLGWPVVVKATERGHPSANTLNVRGPDEMTRAFRRAQQHGRRVIVEKQVSGERFDLVIAGNRLTAVMDASGEDVTSRAHASLYELAAELGQALEFGLFVLTVVSTDIRQSLAQSGGAIIDLDLAPRLESLINPGSVNSELAAERFVRWIYPENAVSRIPIISVTGTNGKTTTTRMAARIMQAAGFQTGAALTDGVFINEVVTRDGDLAGVPGHLYVFESDQVNFAVLETAMGSLADTGLMFDWCNVAVCTNVTQDHIGPGGVATLQQLADLKRSSLECARDAVIVNADDPLCLAMIPGLQASIICLVSTRQSLSDLKTLTAQANSFCVLEDVAGQEHIVLYANEERVEMCAVRKIPATIDGHARFNISNAQHAIAAAWFGGAGKEDVQRVMHRFEMGFDTTRGRINFFHGLPFQVILDYAHNAAGLAAIGELVAGLGNDGRSALLFAAPGDRSNEEIAGMAHAAAGLYDHYYVRGYPNPRGRKPGEVSAILKQALLDSGVSEECISELPVPDQALDQVLAEARPGDLLVVTASQEEFAPTWEKFRALAN
jgi:UDP-N-acetylmuramyl tripeptide synthase